MSEQKPSGALAIAVVPLLVIGVVFGIMLLGSSDDLCNPSSGSTTSISIDPDTVPDTTIAGYGHEQLVNAAYVMQAGKDLSLGVRDQTIGVMTAMGESSLRVIDYGDTAGPDSRGLFQQRDNGAWGSYEDRMDPYISSTNFFTAMMRIDGRDSLEPTIVAHRTQRNADPYHYTKFWDAAVEVVEGLSGLDTGLSGGGQGCGLVPGTVNKDGWAAPAAGPITSRFGPREPIMTPEGPSSSFHRGTDLAPGCDEPIWAAQSGTVIATGFGTRYGSNGTIIIDHGGGVETVYLHMFASGILVNVGDKVTGGQQIAKVGNSGQSDGCHLHFETHVNGEAVDAVLFMAEVGITLG